MKKLIIIGAGSVGGFIANNLEQFDEEYKIIGFLDDDSQKINQIIYGYQLLGPIRFITEYYDSEMMIAMGIAFPKTKKSILNSIDIRKLKFPKLVSKRAWLSPNVKVGAGAIIYPGVSINYNSEVGDFVVVNMNCAIGHDCKIDRFTSLAPGVNFGGNTSVGEACDIGIGVCTKQGISIGSNSVIGGQTMVINDISENSKVVGVPGKVIKPSDDEKRKD